MKPHPIYTYLLISEEGKVFSTKSNKYLKTSLNHAGYERFTNIKPHRVHRLVAETYIPNPENKPEVNHIDGIKTNNHINNLEWCTRQENVTHRDLLNLRNAPKGYKHYLNKATPEMIEECKILFQNGMAKRAIARHFGITHFTVGEWLKR